jgi:hypothetical protein
MSTRDRIFWGAIAVVSTLLVIVLLYGAVSVIA